MLDDFHAQLARKEEQRLKTLSGAGVFWLLIVITLALLALSVSIFGDSGGTGGVATSPTVQASATETTRPPRIYTISYRNSVFSPTNLRIRVGDTVRFRNDGLFPVHIVADADTSLPGFDSVGEVPQNSYFAFTFAAKGVFGYHNAKNEKESGTIIVR